jgi:hypothetical protein
MEHSYHHTRIVNVETALVADLTTRCEALGLGLDQLCSDSATRAAQTRVCIWDPISGLTSDEFLRLAARLVWAAEQERARIEAAEQWDIEFREGAW